MTLETQKSALRESLETLGLNKAFEEKYKACQTREDFDICQDEIKRNFSKLARIHHPDKKLVENEVHIKKLYQAYDHLKKVKDEATLEGGFISETKFDKGKFSKQIKYLESIDFKGDCLPQSTPRPDPTFFGSASNSSRPASAHFGSASNSSRSASAHFGQTGFSIFFIPGVGIILFASHLPSQKPSPSRNPEYRKMPPHQDKNRSQESFNGDTSYEDQKPKSFGFSINDEYLHVKNVNYSNNKFPLGSRKFSSSFCDLLRSKNNDLGYSRGWGRN